MPATSGKSKSNDRLQVMTRVVQFEAVKDQIAQLISNCKNSMKSKILQNELNFVNILNYLLNKRFKRHCSLRRLSL